MPSGPSHGCAGPGPCPLCTPFENLAWGEPSVEGVIAGWLSSPGHCSNLMSRDFAEFGASCVQQPSSPNVPYWALGLARP